MKLSLRSQAVCVLSSALMLMLAGGNARSGPISDARPGRQ